MTILADSWPSLIPLAVGHVALFVVALNMLHSTAISERLLNALNLAWRPHTYVQQALWRAGRLQLAQPAVS